ncbi:putative LysR family transcriptional regulator [Alteromonas naphthalenivorans]|uniref:LysR family transcriptional regulator n=1 Tax=Alteromonas naphthalenivorans TaxID=715451 RepID=F5ZDX6_ALTNA|nr:putative LysR family transcriptional regulator [Alteromonas naphthalenivorans]
MSTHAVALLCLAGQGIALLSHFMVANDLKNGKLISVLGEHLLTPNNREPVQAVYYRNSSVSSRISAFLDFIQSRLTL